MQSWKIRKLGAARRSTPLDPQSTTRCRTSCASGTSLLGIGEAIRLIHRPASLDDVRRAEHRLRFDEAFGLQLVLAQRRAALAALPATPRVAPRRRPAGRVRRAAAVRADGGTARRSRPRSPPTWSRDHPMHRLLQGEVGSGKTVVALRAMLAVVDAGGQAALLAPTEVLAQQHHRSLTAMLGPLAERGLLGGADAGDAGRAAHRLAARGCPSRDAAVTPRLARRASSSAPTRCIQDRSSSTTSGWSSSTSSTGSASSSATRCAPRPHQPPHVLVMTATPIPRTVAMTVFGDLEVSTLTELPPGRAPIVTHVVPAGEKPHFLDARWQRVREEVAEGRQAYVVCPRIGGDEADPSADEEADEDVPYLRLVPDAPEPTRARSTGRRPSPCSSWPTCCRRRPAGGSAGRGPARPACRRTRRTPVMRRFAAGEIDVLVATTVIEVGVDVPNATVMVVMDADRFGVSQLHQLRGRIGRGEAPGLCLLVTDAATARRRANGWTPWRRPSTASSSRGSTSSSAGRATCWAPRSPAARSSLRLLRVLRDEDVIVDGPGRGRRRWSRGPPARRPRRRCAGGRRPARRGARPTSSRRRDRGCGATASRSCDRAIPVG